MDKHSELYVLVLFVISTRRVLDLIDENSRHTVWVNVKSCFKKQIWISMTNDNSIIVIFSCTLIPNWFAVWVFSGIGAKRYFITIVPEKPLFLDINIYITGKMDVLGNTDLPKIYS